MTPSLHVVVAASKGCHGIGQNGKIPWDLPQELAEFKALTTTTRNPFKRNAVVMGRKTWDAIPADRKPLAGRLNIVLSTRAVSDVIRDGGVVWRDVAWARDFHSVLENLNALPDIETVFVIGGESVYGQALASPTCEAVHITEVTLRDEDTTKEFDAFFPWSLSQVASEYRLLASQTVVTSRDSRVASYSRLLYLRRSSHDQRTYVMPPGVTLVHGEQQYLALVRRVISEGAPRDDRTGTGTLSLFGAQMRFDLRRNFPLLTTKRVAWKAVVHELLWFISGSTDAKKLAAKGVNIWNANASREFLDGRGFKDREVGDLGPTYGSLWRHFGATYKDCGTDYSGQGIDQLAGVIRRIRESPCDRRIVMTAWNPSSLEEVALPPCHIMCQFYVANGELSCCMYQRSCDLGLGVPFNIASYALLTCLIAKVTGLAPGDFVHSLGDAHVYINHIIPLQEQLERQPRAFPVLKLSAKTCIDDFTADDIQLLDYTPHNKVPMKMAV